MAIALAAAMATTSASAALVTWDVASGQLPDAAVAQWTLVDTASPEDPTIADGRLLLGGNVGSERMSYAMNGDDLDLSLQSSYWIEARVRVDSRVPYPGWYREPVQLAIRFGGGQQAILELGLDSAYLRDGNNSRGAHTTALDTDNDFHLWRLEVMGQALGSTISVYYDGTLVLTDQTYNQGGAASVSWGEGSTLSGGRSSWQYVATNMARLPDTPASGPAPASAPGTLALAALGLLVANRRRPGIGGGGK